LDVPSVSQEPSGLDLHLVRRFRSQTDLGDARDARDAPRTEMDHLRSLSESRWDGKNMDGLFNKI
jgi:hypothetical protein